MIRLLGWSIRDYLTFSDTTIKLADEHGLYVVSGDNRDSTISDNTNAVGKSRLFSCIATALFENDPMSLDKRNRKQVLKAKTSSTSVEIAPHSGAPHQITQTPSKIFIAKANKKGEYEDQQAIKLEVARNNIAQLFPMSEKMFYATCYIQAQRPCDFQRAKPRERLAFITELFNLDIYDKIRKEFARRLSELAKTGVEYKTLADELVETQRRLQELNFKEDKAKHKKLKAKISEIQDKLSSLYEQRGGIVSQLEAASTRVRVEKKRKKLLEELRAISKDIKPSKETVRALKADLALAEEHAAYKREAKRHQDSVAKIEEKIELLPEVPKGATLESVSSRMKADTKLADSLEKQLSTVESEWESYKEQVSDYELQKERAAKLLKKVEQTKLYTKFNLGKLDSAKKILAKVQPVIDMANVTVALSESLEDVDDHIDSCPICSSKVSFDSIKKTVKEARIYLKEFDIIQDYLDVLNAVLSKPKKPSGDIAKLKEEFSVVCKRLDTAEEVYNTLKKLRDYNESLDELKSYRPKKPKSQPRFDAETCSSAIELVVEINAIDQSLGTSSSVDCESLEKKLKTIKKSISSLTDELEPLEKRKRSYEVSKSNFELLVEQRDKLESKLKKIGPELEKQKLYKALVDAYSPNKLKLQDAEKILSWLEDSLNRYSHLVFLEPMKFQIRTQKDGISAVAIRNNGESSDISQLSGAETNCFRLLLALSLIPLLPENKRTNFLILDEPDNNSSDAVRSHLIREFLPKLRAVVPHVFWITPKPVDEFDDYRLIKVIKQGGISEVEIVSNED